MARLLWKSNFQYYIDKNPAAVNILSLMNTVHTDTSYGRSLWILSFRFWYVSQVVSSLQRISNLSHVCYMSLPPHPSVFDHCNRVWWTVQVMHSLSQLSVIHYTAADLLSCFTADPLSPLRDSCRRHPDMEGSWKLGGMLTILVKKSYTVPIF
jgi:hypothetical protein